LARALGPFAAWINGRKRFQGGLRAELPVVEDDGTRLKFNPFANVSREDIEAIYATAKLPPHPLVASGFLSVGCMPCTSRATSDEHARAGRWRGRAKTECGIHTMKTS
jgi:phosphoadenosine phosphosulfate reductase